MPSDKQRIDQLSRPVPETTERTIGDVQIVENAEANRIQLIFPAKPSEQVRALLKQNGFRWSPTEGAWQRMLNNSGRGAAEYVLARLTEIK